eukprot:PhM_4_TR1682/c0_g1_i1/m.74858
MNVTPTSSAASSTRRPSPLSEQYPVQAYQKQVPPPQSSYSSPSPSPPGYDSNNYNYNGGGSNSIANTVALAAARDELIAMERRRNDTLDSIATLAYQLGEMQGRCDDVRAALESDLETHKNVRDQINVDQGTLTTIKKDIAEGRDQERALQLSVQELQKLRDTIHAQATAARTDHVRLSQEAEGMRETLEALRRDIQRVQDEGVRADLDLRQGRRTAVDLEKSLHKLREEEVQVQGRVKRTREDLSDAQDAVVGAQRQLRSMQEEMERTKDNVDTLRRQQSEAFEGVQKARRAEADARRGLHDVTARLTMEREMLHDVHQRRCRDLAALDMQLARPPPYATNSPSPVSPSLRRMEGYSDDADDADAEARQQEITQAKLELDIVRRSLEEALVERDRVKRNIAEVQSQGDKEATVIRRVLDQAASELEWVKSQVASERIELTTLQQMRRGALLEAQLSSGDPTPRTRSPPTPTSVVIVTAAAAAQTDVTGPAEAKSVGVQSDQPTTSPPPPPAVLSDMATGMSRTSSASSTSSSSCISSALSATSPPTRPPPPPPPPPPSRPPRQPLSLSNLMCLFDVAPSAVAVAVTSINPLGAKSVNSISRSTSPMLSALDAEEVVTQYNEPLHRAATTPTGGWITVNNPRLLSNVKMVPTSAVATGGRLELLQRVAKGTEYVIPIRDAALTLRRAAAERQLTRDDAADHVGKLLRHVEALIKFHDDLILDSCDPDERRLVGYHKLWTGDELSSAGGSGRSRSSGGGSRRLSPPSSSLQQQGPKTKPRDEVIDTHAFPLHLMMMKAAKGGNRKQQQQHQRQRGGGGGSSVSTTSNEAGGGAPAVDVPSAADFDLFGTNPPLTVQSLSGVGGGGG